MRISGSTANAAIATPAAPRRAAAGNFTVSEGQSARAPGAPVALRSVGGIEALIALQGFDPTERRKQAVTRGRIALDVLDELKIEVLGGTLSPAMLGKLKAVAGALNDRSGDDRLDDVLGEIELRVAVEIAKMAPR